MLNEADKTNYFTLMRAIDSNNVALMQVKRRLDGKEVAAICAVGFDAKTQEHTFTPFAIMVEGNPFEDFFPPNPDGGYYDENEPIEINKEETNGKKKSKSAQSKKTEKEDRQG